MKCLRQCIFVVCRVSFAIYDDIPKGSDKRELDATYQRCNNSSQLLLLLLFSLLLLLLLYMILLLHNILIMKTTRISRYNSPLYTATSSDGETFGLH